jgi:hypothetical protein
MLYARADDVVAVTHGAFIVFLLIGAFLAWRWPSTGMGTRARRGRHRGIFVLGADCPLTDLEKYFRRQAGERAHRRLIAHYLLPTVPDRLRTVALPLFVVGVNAAAYAGYVASRRHASIGPGLTRRGTGRRRRLRRPQGHAFGAPNGASGAANELTITEWDPVSKQPHFKVAAVRVQRIDESERGS